MQTAKQPQSMVLTYGLIIIFIGFAMYRRTRRQPVRPARAVITASIIVLLSVAGLAASREHDALAFILAPVALLAGLGLGWLMMGTIHFWYDEGTSQLWMQGGLLYILIWLAAYVLRLGVEYLAGGAAAFTQTVPTHTSSEALTVLATDLLFLSIGLWVARAAALLHRYRSVRRSDA